MTLSTGAKVENSRMFAKHETALACVQRSAKKRRTQAIHAKITNSRKHFLHKETTKIADVYGFMCVGNVSGRWLQATNGKSSADASTGMSRNMLRYKAIARVATFVDTCEHLKHSDLLRMRMRRRPERAEGSRNKRMDVRRVRCCS
jgi:transposase